MAKRDSAAWTAALWTAVAALAVAEKAGLLSPVNQAAYHALYSPSRLWELASATAATPVVAAYYAVWLLLEARRGRLGERLVFSATSMILALAAVYALKAALRVPRPGAAGAAGGGLAWLLLHADRYSYPSGHAAKATVLARTLPRRGRAVSAALWGWAALVYASRLALGAHWLGDVAGGGLAGLAAAETVGAAWGRVAGLLRGLSARLGLECC